MYIYAYLCGCVLGVGLKALKAQAQKNCTGCGFTEFRACHLHIHANKCPHATFHEALSMRGGKQELRSETGLARRLDAIL